MNYKIGTIVKIFLSKSDKDFYKCWIITWIKPYGDWFQYYVVDNWYYDFQTHKLSDEELWTFFRKRLDF